MSAFLFDAEKVRHFYQRYIKKHGLTSGWATEEDKINCYCAASSCSAQQWHNFSRVLDVGSGQGHFVQFLRQEMGFSGEYTGIELLEVLHKKATGLYGHLDQTHFIQSDFLHHDFGLERFDWVFALGPLTVKQNSQAECDRAFCSKMIELAQYGVSIFLNDINFMRPGRLEEVPELAAHNIENFIAMVKENFTVAHIEVLHYPVAQSQTTMVHIIL